DELTNSLQELSEGIDVLNILEHAYNSTLKAHTNPSLPIPTPLTTGSSTALLAVLDHPPQPSTQDSKINLYQSPPLPERNYAAGSLPHPPHPTFARHAASPKSDPMHTPLGTHSNPASHITPSSPSQPPTCTPNISAGSQNNNLSIDAKAPSHAESQDVVQSYDAVLRIAHLGDCMGMLVRADDIVWRSDEMWWGYNHPLQLGPMDPSLSSSSTKKTGDKVPLPTQPHTFTLPVKQDDILILASDGLSDNLWDDDILDEVIKFRRGFNWDESAPSYSSTPSLSNLHISSSTALRRKAFAGMLSEALCSRAKRVSERRGSRSAMRKASEIPFARRARMSGKVFRGGKPDGAFLLLAIV
ncbi:hypothetical protein BJ165DRAFT_1321850, partial [Panaeolus papilionaceus]